MAYARRSRRTTRGAYSGRRSSYRARSTRAAPRRRSRRMSGRSGGGRTIRIVVQTVGASPVSGVQSSVQPLRAQF